MHGYSPRMADEHEKVDIPQGAPDRYRSSIFNALRNLHSVFLHRLVIKHESEWYDGRANPTMEKYHRSLFSRFF